MNKKAIVVDTNVVFKTLRLKNSAIRTILSDDKYHLKALFLSLQIPPLKNPNRPTNQINLFKSLGILLKRDPQIPSKRSDLNWTWQVIT